MGIGCGQIKIRFMKYGFSLVADMRNFMVGLRKLFHQLKVRPVVVLVSSSLPNIALASSVLYLMLLGTLASCDPNKQHVKNELLEKISKKIYLIDSLKSFSIKNGWSANKETNTNYKLAIVTYINGSCSSCIYELERWKTYISENQIEDLSFLFYVKAYNNQQLREVLNSIQFDFPVIIDNKNTFYNTNKLSENKMYQTFLVDKNNLVLLVGNPIYSVKVKELYNQVISEAIPSRSN